MERNDKFDQQIINLVTARHKGVVWELDKELINYIKDMVVLPSLMIDDSRTAIHYNGVLIHRYIHSREPFERKYRNIDEWSKAVSHLRSMERSVTYLILHFAIKYKDFEKLDKDTILNLGMGSLFEGIRSLFKDSSHIEGVARGERFQQDAIKIIDQLPKELKELQYLMKIKDETGCITVSYTKAEIEGEVPE